MAVPEIIPISYEPDYRTDTIGHWDRKVSSQMRQGACWSDR